MAYYNISQLTNFDVAAEAQKPQSAVVTTSLAINKKDTQEIETIPYYCFTTTFLKSNAVKKFGYCVNNNQGVNYPIFLKVNSNNKSTDVDGFFQVYVGDNGMYEIQPEYWYDRNAEDTSEKEIKLEVLGVRVPANVPFVIDYAYKTGE